MTSCMSVTYTELEQVQSQCTHGPYQVLRREDPPSLVSPFQSFQQHCELTMIHTFQDLAIFVDYNNNNTDTNHFILHACMRGKNRVTSH